MFTLRKYLFLPLLLSLSVSLFAVENYEKPIPADIKNAVLPGFSLRDINENSKSYGQLINLEDYRGRTVLVYFGSVG